MQKSFSFVDIFSFSFLSVFGGACTGKTKIRIKLRFFWSYGRCGVEIITLNNLLCNFSPTCRTQQQRQHQKHSAIGNKDENQASLVRIRFSLWRITTTTDADRQQHNENNIWISSWNDVAIRSVEQFENKIKFMIFFVFLLVFFLPFTLSPFQHSPIVRLFGGST